MRICTFVVLLLLVFSLCRLAVGNENSFVNNTGLKLRILAVLAHLGKSHFDVFKPLLEELARRGHDLTVLSHFPRSENAKSTETLPTYKDISLLDPRVGVFVDVVDLHRIRHSLIRHVMEFHMLRNMSDVACNACLKNPAVKELLRSDERFDLILMENFYTDCFLGFVHRFKVPYITVLAHPIITWIENNKRSVNHHSSYIPTALFAEPMDFLARVADMLVRLACKVAYNYWYRPINDRAIVDEIFGSDCLNLKTIAEQSLALLVNTHSSLHGSKSHLPNVVEVGGLHIPPKTNPLPRDLAEFLDSAPEGLLYFNFGSMIKMTTMPRKKLDAILEVFGSLPRKVIWKWEDVLPRKMDNVMARKWFPQFDVLSKRTSEVLKIVLQKNAKEFFLN